MKALKFYDKEGTGYELFMDYEKQSIMMQIDVQEGMEDSQLLEIDENDIDDIIISLVELKNEINAIRNSSSN
jgi:hypothetical protein